MLYQKITIHPIPALKDNYIWLLKSNNNNDCWIVDPGEAKPVINYVKDNSLILSGILITHHHYDHTGGIQELLSIFGTMPVYGSHNSPCQYITHPVREGGVISLLEIYLDVLEIPGHTLDHIAYFNNDIIFCGDTLFSAGCGKIFEGTPSIMYDSITKIYNLKNEIDIYCAHEYTLNNLKFSLHVDPNNNKTKIKITEVEKLVLERKCTIPSKLVDEKTYNPFLRCDTPAIKSAVSEHFGNDLNDTVEIFKYLREWKNGYIPSI